MAPRFAGFSPELLAALQLVYQFLARGIGLRQDNFTQHKGDARKKQADKKAEEKKRQELELLAELKRKHEGA